MTVAEPGDFILAAGAVGQGFLDHIAAQGLSDIHIVQRSEEVPRGATLVPWGWTPELVRLAAHHGWVADAPNPHAVRTANSRRFSLELEQEWSVGLPGADVILSLEDLQRRLRGFSAGQRWVLKANFGMSARERLLGRGPALSDAAAGWTQKRLSIDGRVIFEPWVERIAEAGVQVTIPLRGAPHLDGVTPLLCDDSGQYRGSRFSPAAESDAVWARAIETALRAGERLQQLGYFGPLGIDAMRYRDADGIERLRPLQDINARWTMGRLSLGLRRLSRRGEHATWLHVRWPTAPQSLPNVRSIRTSAFEINGEPTQQGTMALFAPDEQTMRAAELL